MKSTEESRIQVFNELNNEVIRISKRINHTRGMWPSYRLCIARRYLKESLRMSMTCPTADRISALMNGLQRAELELNKSRKDFHSKQVKSVREDIAEVLERYA
jgi:hypothetical protein